MHALPRRRLITAVLFVLVAAAVELAVLYFVANRESAAGAVFNREQAAGPEHRVRAVSLGRWTLAKLERTPPNFAESLESGTRQALSAGVPGLDDLPLFVNMIDQNGAGRYEIGRFDAGAAVQTTLLVPAADACHLWSPAAIHVDDEIWLYAAEHDCTGWHRIVLFRSSDGGYTFTRRGVVFETTDQLRRPTVVYDRGSFHLWYTIDRGGLGRALAYAHSHDGTTFTRRGVKVWARRLNAMAVTEVVRLGNQWRMFITSYNSTLTAATAYLFGFDNPDGRYSLIGPVDVEGVAPKVDVALICRDRRGDWRGVFTAYGDDGNLFGYEWTVAFRAPALRGPWRRDAAVRSPYLRLSYNGPKTSVENAEVTRENAEVLPCH